MKSINTIILFLFLCSACIETDIVEDQIVAINIDTEANGVNNGQLAALIGDEFSFTAMAENDRGIKFQPEVEWTSTNTSVATIDNEGHVVVISQGESIIYGKAQGKESNQVILKAIGSSNEIARVTVTASKSEIDIDETLQFQAVAENINGEANFPDATFEWESLNESVATVDQNGLVTGVSNGGAMIQATTGNVSGSTMIMVGEASARNGSFSSLNGYSVSGDVSLVETSSNLNLILQDNFSASNGPGLYIYLSNNSNNVNGGVEIGELRKNNGSDTYAVNASVALEDYNYVLIWCKPFGVGFGTAQLN